MRVRGIDRRRNQLLKDIFAYFSPYIQSSVSSPPLFFFPPLAHRHFIPSLSYLKSPHVPWVSRSLQTILVAFQEKLQEEPAKVNKRTRVCTSATKKNHMKEWRG